jgi:uncharacterized protein (TIGR03437 family)
MAMALSAVAFAQTPVIATGATAVVNNASYAPAGLPNSAVAQGSIFAIFGSNLGPANIAQQPSYPLQRTLAGTSVRVTVGGTTVDAIPIYTVSSQVGAVLPSNTPTGTGQVTVTYNGQTSAPRPITVVPSSFGTFTINQAGSGPGVVTDANYSVMTLNNAANPGQPLIIWGTGLGPITGDDAATPQPRDLTNIPVEVWIGNQQATISYRGRSGCCAGLDQIVVIVPQNVTGCYNSLIVKIGNVVSNVTTIPIAQSGRVCTDPNMFSASELNAIFNRPNVSLGYIDIGRTVSETPGISIPGVPPQPATTTRTDDASAFFYRYTPQQWTASQGLFGQASVGSCTVFTFSGASAGSVDPVRPTILNAGASISVNGPNGTRQLPREAQTGFYFATLGGNDGQTTTPLYIPDNGGQFSFTNGSGGPDVGGFNANLTLGTPLVWSNMSQTTQVQRANGLPITWTGGQPGTQVVISGASISYGSASSPTPDPNSAVVAGFTCTAPVSAGNFTVPSAVLLALPATTSFSVGGFTMEFPGSLSVANVTNPQRFTAPNLDFGFITGHFTFSKGLPYR